MVCVLSEASLGSSVFRRASSFRRKTSVRIALIPLAGSDLLAAGPKLGCQGPVSASRAPKRRWCVCGSRVCLSGAEAPLVRLREPLRGLPAHAEACVVDRCGRVVVPLCPKANWIPALCRSAAWGRHRPGGTEVLRASWRRRSGSWKARSWLPKTAKPRKALRRSAPSSLSLCGPKPGRGGLTVRKRAGGGRVSLVTVRRTARG
jgi:hypothetical protein